MENKILELAAIVKKTYSNINSEFFVELISDLKDIILVVNELEERMDIKYEDTNAYDILDEALHILEDNGENANRLFMSFSV